jgi:hypothetical protein
MPELEGSFGQWWLCKLGSFQWKKQRTQSKLASAKQGACCLRELRSLRSGECQLHPHRPWGLRCHRTLVHLHTWFSLSSKPNPGCVIPDYSMLRVVSMLRVPASRTPGTTLTEPVLMARGTGHTMLLASVTFCCQTESRNKQESSTVPFFCCDWGPQTPYRSLQVQSGWGWGACHLGAQL